MSRSLFACIRRAQSIRQVQVAAIVVLSWLATANHCAAEEALPSWNDGPSKAAIVEFVAKVTKEGGSDFVRPAERIAVFDNDGTLWCEQPVYF